jgi:hypothetical protein
VVWSFQMNDEQRRVALFRLNPKGWDHFCLQPRCLLAYVE